MYVDSTTISCAANILFLMLTVLLVGHCQSHKVSNILLGVIINRIDVGVSKT